MAARAAIDDFLAQDGMAVVGLSRDAKSFSYSVYRELVDHGYDITARNRGADTIVSVDDNVTLRRDRGIAVIDGACPLMFLPHTGLVHCIHRAERHLTGRLPA